MQMLFNLLTNKAQTIEDLQTKSSCKRFFTPDQEAIAFTERLSKKILNTPEAHAYPALQALGFWLRKANLSTIIRENLTPPQTTSQIAAGTVFQIPPHNVDMLFGYTTLLSLICGNITIARLWEQRTDEQNCFLSLMRESLQDEFKTIKNRLFLLTYDKDDATTKALSSLCDVRMVWGGDTTINAIQKIPLPPLAHEARFADRFSAAIINASHFLSASDDEQINLIQNFTRDLFTFNQMACTSPRLLFWHGTENDKESASRHFYKKIAIEAAETKATPNTGAMVAKNNMQFLALHDLDIKEQTTVAPELTILTLNSPKKFDIFKGLAFGNGMLFDTTIKELNELSIWSTPKDQTLSYWGSTPEEIKEIVQNTCFERFVPIGQSLTFDPIWDGYNLFNVMTKLIKVK